MINVSISSNIAAAVKRLGDDAKQVPFAVSRALNRSMFEAMNNVEKVMRTSLDRPTTYTLKSLRVVRSDKKNLEARLDYKNTPGGQRPAESYLYAQIEGNTARRPKALEKLLISKGAIPPGSYLVPTTSAKLDANGNWMRSQIRQVALSLNVSVDKVSAARLDKARARQASGLAKRKAEARFFVVAKEGADGLPPGVYERVKSAFGSGAKLLAILKTQAPRYRKRLPFYEVANRVAVGRFEKLFEEELKAALATKRN